MICLLIVSSTAFFFILSSQYRFREGSSGEDAPLTITCRLIGVHENFSRNIPFCLLPNTQRSLESRLSCPQYLARFHLKLFPGCMRLTYLSALWYIHRSSLLNITFDTAVLK